MVVMTGCRDGTRRKLWLRWRLLVVISRVVLLWGEMSARGDVRGRWHRVWMWMWMWMMLLLLVNRLCG